MGKLLETVRQFGASTRTITLDARPLITYEWARTDDESTSAESEPENYLHNELGETPYKYNFDEDVATFIRDGKLEEVLTQCLSQLPNLEVAIFVPPATKPGLPDDKSELLALRWSTAMKTIVSSIFFANVQLKGLDSMGDVWDGVAAQPSILDLIPSFHSRFMALEKLSLGFTGRMNKGTLPEYAMTLGKFVRDSSHLKTFGLLLDYENSRAFFKRLCKNNFPWNLSHLELLHLETRSRYLNQLVGNTKSTLRVLRFEHIDLYQGCWGDVFRFLNEETQLTILSIVCLNEGEKAVDLEAVIVKLEGGDPHAVPVSGLHVEGFLTFSEDEEHSMKYGYTALHWHRLRDFKWGPQDRGYDW